MTAVDTLWDMIPKDTQRMIEKQFDGHNKAKEMEKEQIEDAYWDGCGNWDNEKKAENYYNETYGGNK